MDAAKSRRQAAMLRRTQLFVPANKPQFVSKAAASGADAVIVDLEDSLPPDQRASAHQLLGGTLAALREAAPNLHLLVRINPGEAAEIDVVAAVTAGADGILVPKVETQSEVRRIEELVKVAERDMGRSGIELQLLVETPRGVLELPAIASAGSRVVALMLGTEDLAAELEVDPLSPHADFGWAHGALVCAARAYGLAPYGLLGSISIFDDLDQLRVLGDRSRAFGYLGSLCIHPSQVSVLNDTFSPSPGEIAEAHRVLAALARGHETGTAAIRYQGRLLDTPMAMRARRLLARAGSPVTEAAPLPGLTAPAHQHSGLREPRGSEWRSTPTP